MFWTRTVVLSIMFKKKPVVSTALVLVAVMMNSSSHAVV